MWLIKQQRNSIQNRLTGDRHITSWKQFAKHIRSRGCDLLAKLEKFPNAVLVTGCQRSGTTMLTRIITRSEGMKNYWFGKDDELDAALLLSGWVEHDPQGRYCFQTTYINECFKEYLNGKKDYKMIWVLRNPHSVVYSQVYNWKRFALNELFKACGLQYLTKREIQRYIWLGNASVKPIRRACLSYNGKLSQLFSLKQQLNDNQLIIVNYDDLVNKPDTILRSIYKFIDLEYRSEYTNYIKEGSLTKAQKLTKKQSDLINNSCLNIYEAAKDLVDKCGT